MTTAHHPVPVGTSSHHVRMWLEVAGVVVLAVITALAIVWLINRSDDSATVSVSDQVSGFDYTAEATGGRIAAQGVTAPFVGESGVLYPDVPISGFEYNADATTGHVAAPGVIPPFVGSSG